MSSCRASDVVVEIDVILCLYYFATKSSISIVTTIIPTNLFFSYISSRFYIPFEKHEGSVGRRCRFKKSYIYCCRKING